MKRKLLSMALLAISALGFHANAQQYEDGADLTNLIVNPGFEEADGKGWSLDTSKGGTGTLTNWHGGNATNYCAEAYNQNFDVYQIIEGVPDGLYEVSVQAFYRTGDNQSAWNAYQSDPEMQGAAKVYPEVYLNEFSTKIRNVMEIQFANGELDASNTNTWPTPDGTYTLDGMTSASNAFSLADPERNFTMPAYGLVTDGKIRLGIRKLEGPTAGGFWTLWDNFKLTYRAKNETALTSVINSMVEQYSNYADLNTEYINAYESALVDAAIKAASEAIGKDGDTMYDALIALNAAYNDTKAHVAAETSLEAAMKALENALANEEARQDDVDAGKVLKDEDTDNYTTTEIEDLIEKIYKAIAAINYPRFDLATMEEPRSATALIVNPGFETGDLTGWVNNGTVDAQTQDNNDLPAGIKQGTWYAEKWHVNGTIDLSQTINDLPEGVYEVRAYAYSSASDAVLYAEKSEVSISTAQQYRISNIILEDESNSITFGVKWSDTGSYWTTFDVFELWYYGSAKVTEVEVAVSEIGYATFSSELPLDLANIDGGTAYIVADEAAEDGSLKLTEQTEAVPANTGLIIAKENGGTVTIPVAATANPLEKKNYLVAGEGEEAPAGSYVLSCKYAEGGEEYDLSTVGFYAVTDDQPIVENGKAYLDFDGAISEAKVLHFVFGDDNATAVEAIEVAETEADGALYNVAGQQVGNDYKGIVIKNGKKYLNK